MNIDDKYLSIKVIGPGKEFFQEIPQENKKEFSENKLYIGITEGFSAPEITTVMITIGGSVLTTLAAHYLIKLIDSIFAAKKHAKDSGVSITMNITINNGDQYINLGSDIEEIKQKIIKAKSKSE